MHRDYDTLLHDAEHAEAGAKLAAVFGDLRESQRLWDKAQSLRAEAAKIVRDASLSPEED